jgi:hypothetical protein
MAFQVIQTLHKKFTKENDKSETPVSIFSTTRFTKWCALQACLLPWWWSCLHPIATLQCWKSTACTVVTSHSEEPPHGADIAFHTSSTMPCLLKNTRYLVPSEHRSISKAAIVHEQVLWYPYRSGSDDKPCGLQLLNQHSAGPLPVPKRCLSRKWSVTPTSAW